MVLNLICQKVALWCVYFGTLARVYIYSKDRGLNPQGGGVLTKMGGDTGYRGFTYTDVFAEIGIFS